MSFCFCLILNNTFFILILYSTNQHSYAWNQCSMPFSDRPWENDALLALVNTILQNYRSHSHATLFPA
jgi:hypothetical protein